MWNKTNPNWWWCKLKSNTSAWMAVYPDGEYSIWDHPEDSFGAVCVFRGMAENMEQAVVMGERVAKNRGYKKA